jgi:hypothetical protein
MRRLWGHPHEYDQVHVWQVNTLIEEVDGCKDVVLPCFEMR